MPGQLTSGPGWSWNARNQNIDVRGAGVTLSGLDIAGGIDVWADNVTITDSRITATGETWGVGLHGTSGTTVQDTAISSPAATGPDRLTVGIKDVTGTSSNTRIVSNDISHTATGVQTHEGLIADNYIHDLGLTTGDHVNGITSNGATTPLTIRHNTVFNPWDQTDAIGLFEDFGTEGNRVIDDNLLAGGGYPIYAGQNPGGPTAFNIDVTNNRIARLYFPNGGGYGPLAAYRAGNGNTFTGNTWDDTGATINP